MTHPLQTVPILEWHAGAKRRLLDEVAAEEPLEIRVNGEPITVTMRTPGDDYDLACGLLFTEGIVQTRDEITRVGHQRKGKGGRNCNVVNVTLRPGTLVDHDRLRRHLISSSSCGICGKASIDAVRARGIRPLSGEFRFDAERLIGLPETLRHAQAVFGRTGGLHAAALFDAAGQLVAIREDIGRHNAVDKIVGHALIEGHVPITDRLLFVSGRGGFEIVQKAVVAGVPILASVSAPSSLAVELARETGLTLIGFVRAERFVVYSGDDRLSSTEDRASAPSASAG